MTQNTNAAAIVKSAYEISDYLKNAGVNLKPAGVSQWKACCPFHNEKTPSFSVSDSFQNYKCFGCDASGDIIAYVMNKENLSFTESIQKLAADKNIELQIADNESSVDYESLRKVMKEAAYFYWKSFRALPESHPAKTEVSKRDLQLDPSKDFAPQYGFAPNGYKLIEYLRKKGFSDEIAKQAGLYREKDGKYYDFFRGRLMFFFRDRQGRHIGFSSRKLYDDDIMGKYVNSPETPLFLKSKVLYNHDLARKTANKKKAVYITEGQFDVAAFCESDMPNTVAASGTSFTNEHAQECKRMVGDDGKLVFCFDGDEAGIKAAKRVFTSIPDIHEDAYVVVFPEAQDPCDYRMQHGSERLHSYVQKHESLVEFMVKQEKTGYSMDSVVDQAKYVEQAARVIKTITNLTLRETSMRLLSLESQTPLDVIREAVRNAKPYTFQEFTSHQHQEQKNDENQGNEVKDAVEEVDLDVARLQTIKENMKRDFKYSLSAKFFSLGMTRKAWRAGVVRSKKLLPEEFHPIVEELEKFSERSSIFPELFDNIEVAKFLINSEFSNFYRFMDEYEIRDHLNYLATRLRELDDNNKERLKITKVVSMLEQDETMSLEYFKKVLVNTSI